MTNPHDDALLQDLLDGRLEPAAADEIRRRIAVEPELSAAWDELRRLRDAVRALPAPPVPAGFVEGVRRRVAEPESAVAARAEAGAPPPAAAAGATSGPPPTGDGASPSQVSKAPRGRLFRMASWKLAAAAVVLVAGTAAVLWTPHREAGPANSIETSQAEPRRVEADRGGSGGARSGLEADRVHRTDFEAGEADRADGEKGAEGAKRDDRLAAAMDEAERHAWKEKQAASGGSKPEPAPAPTTPAEGYRAPGGAVPPGLREPSDTPTPPPAPPPATSPSAGPGVPVAGGAPPTGGVPPVSLGAPSSSTGGAAPAGSAGGTLQGRAGPALKKIEAPPLAWAREGVVQAYVMRASSLDEARARVALLRTRIATGDAATKLDDAAKSAPSEANRRVGGGGAGAGKAPAAEPAPPAEPLAVPLDALERKALAGKAPAAQDVVLGSFVLDLDSEARLALVMVPDAPAAAAAMSADDESVDKSRDAKGARAGRVRIVVLAEPVPAAVPASGPAADPTALPVAPPPSPVPAPAMPPTPDPTRPAMR